MIDWDLQKRLLIEATEPVVRVFQSRRPEDRLCAIGYVFELGNANPQFDLCADTERHRREVEHAYRAKWPDTDMEAIRWNSGEYQCPAGLGTAPDELGIEWCRISALLHETALDDEHLDEVYTGIIRICCDALVVLAKRGALGDWTDLDFNVSETLDDIAVVKERHAMIRAAIVAPAA